MKCRRIIFLDFNGVLATDNYDDLLIEKKESLRDLFGRKFDPCCVAALKRIVETTDAEIVITSSWRQYLNLFGLRLLWIIRRMPGRVMGCTPAVSDNRGLEIQHWLSVHRGITSYVILDDMDQRQFEECQTRNLVTCNHYAGLSKNDALTAIQILMTE